jgi:hypothetical protein
VFTIYFFKKDEVDFLATTGPLSTMQISEKELMRKRMEN